MNEALQVKSLYFQNGNFRMEMPEFTVQKGTITGLIGKNGAGKTTLIKLIMDVIQPAMGDILLDGVPMRGNEEQVKSKIAVVYDSLIYPRYLTAKGVASMVGPFYAHFDKQRFLQLLERFEIQPNKRLYSFSKGMEAKYSVALALAANPDILILDEPTSGLDPSARVDLLDLLLEFMQDESKTVFFSTHITSDLDKIADYIALMDEGKLVFNEEKEALMNQYALVQLEKATLTDALRENICGIKENSFGYVGLCRDRALLQGVEGVKLARPTVEDIMIYRGGLT